MRGMTPKAGPQALHRARTRAPHSTQMHTLYSSTMARLWGLLAALHLVFAAAVAQQQPAQSPGSARY